MERRSHVVPLYLKEAVMLLQIFILEACPDLQYMKADKTCTQIFIYTYSLLGRQQTFCCELQNTIMSKHPPLMPWMSCLPASPAVTCHVSKDLNPMIHLNHLAGWHVRKGKEKWQVFHANKAFSRSNIQYNPNFAGVYQNFNAYKLAVISQRSQTEGSEVCHLTVAP